MPKKRWKALKDRSKVMRTIDQWEEHRDTAAKLLFYYNVDNDEYSWRKPRIVLQEEQMTFGEEAAGETIDDWERAQRKAQSLWKVAGWEECRHIDTGTIFYSACREWAVHGRNLPNLPRLSGDSMAGSFSMIKARLTGSFSSLTQSYFDLLTLGRSGATTRQALSTTVTSTSQSIDGRSLQKSRALRSREIRGRRGTIRARSSAKSASGKSAATVRLLRTMICSGNDDCQKW